MSAPWKPWLAKFDALATRERWLVAAALLVVLLFLGHALFISGWSSRHAALKSSLPTQRAELQDSQAQLANLRAQLATHPDDSARARMRQIDEKIAAIDAELQSVARQLVPPEQMATLLEDLLVRNRRLQLVKMSTLPATALLDSERPSVPAPRGEDGEGEGAPASAAAENAPNPAAAENSERPQIWRHGTELTLRGSYFDMLDYITQIEALPWQMYWGSLKLDARDHSRLELTLRLYTISLERTWLTI